MIYHRKIVETSDDSSTIFVEGLSENYHSSHGARTESEKVFLEYGLEYLLKSHEIKEVNILEYGFGTGLNALLTWDYARNLNLKINYTTIEKYPLNESEFILFAESISPKNNFIRMHECPWESRVELDSHFSITKLQQDFRDFKSSNASFHIIYFDAFAPQKQPALWTVEIFSEAFKALVNSGILTTYTVMGEVKRNLKKVGFIIEKLPGPAGKREVLRAIKN